MINLLETDITLKTQLISRKKTKICLPLDFGYINSTPIIKRQTKDHYFPKKIRNLIAEKESLEQSGYPPANRENYLSRKTERKNG